MPRKPSLSRHFFDARIARGLSVVDLAERVGVSQASIYFREDGGSVAGSQPDSIVQVLKLPIE